MIVKKNGVSVLVGQIQTFCRYLFVCLCKEFYVNMCLGTALALTTSTVRSENTQNKIRSEKNLA